MYRTGIEVVFCVQYTAFFTPALVMTTFIPGLSLSVTSTPLLHQRQEPEFRSPLEPMSVGRGLRRTAPAAAARGRSATSGLRRSLLSDFDAANVTT